MKQLYNGFNNQPLPSHWPYTQVEQVWHPIVADLINDLIQLGWDGGITQIKEKFGALRFYIPQGSDEMFDRIDEAEHATTKICANCGKPATTTTKGWITYVCDEHAAQPE